MKKTVVYGICILMACVLFSGCLTAEARTEEHVEVDGIFYDRDDKDVRYKWINEDDEGRFSITIRGVDYGMENVRMDEAYDGIEFTADISGDRVLLHIPHDMMFLCVGYPYLSVDELGECWKDGEFRIPYEKNVIEE